MIDIYLLMIARFWKSHFKYLDETSDHEKAQARKDRFLLTLNESLPVTALKYSDTPVQAVIEEDDGNLVSIAQISDTDEPAFAEKIGEHTLLTVERFEGVWCALYAIEETQE